MNSSSVCLHHSVDSLQRGMEAQHIGLPESQGVHSVSSPVEQIRPDEFAVAFGEWFPRFLRDPFILQLPLVDLFFHQMNVLFRGFEPSELKEKDICFYYLEMSRELHKWRQGDAVAKETLIKILSSFSERVPPLQEEKGKTSLQVMKEKEAIISLWIGIFRSCSYEQLLLTPKEIKKLYVNKDEDPLNHPLLKQSSFTRAEYENYGRLLAYHELKWSLNSLLYTFGEFNLDALTLEKIIVTLKSFIEDQNDEWEAFLSKRLVVELGLKPGQVVDIQENYRKKFYALLFEYTKLIGLTNNQNQDFRDGLAMDSREGFALLYIHNHRAVIQSDGGSILHHIESIRKHSQGLVKLSKSVSELYEQVYNCFLFLESDEIEQFAKDRKTGNFATEFDKSLSAFSEKRKESPLQKKDPLEEIKIMKRYQQADKFPDFLRIRRDVFVPFNRFVKDISFSTQATVGSALSRLDSLGKIQVIKLEKPKTPPKERSALSHIRQTKTVIDPEEARSSKQITPAEKASRSSVLAPPVILTGEQLLHKIEKKLNAKLDLVKMLLHPLAKERIMNAKVHLANVLIHLSRLTKSCVMTKKELLSTLSGIGFEMNLGTEQVLMALVLYNKRVKNVEEMAPYRSHDLKASLVHCDDSIEKQWGAFLTEVDGMGTFLIDMGLLHPGALPRFQQILFGLYQSVENNKNSFPAEAVKLCKSLTADFFKFYDHVATCFDFSSQDKVVTQESDGWKDHESQVTLSRAPIDSYPNQHLFHGIKAHMTKLEGQVHSSYIHNIVSNTISRLEQSIVFLQEQKPKRAFLDFSTIFFLNQVLAEQVLEVCHLIKKKEINHAMYDHDLEKMAGDLGEFSFTADEKRFLQKGKEVRQVARYPMSLSLQKSDLSTLLDQIMVVSKSSPDMNSLPKGFLIVASKHKNIDFEALQNQILDDCILLERILKKVLEGCHL